MIISLHTPKTAGLSFKQVLRGHFGDKLIEEYIDLPLQHSRESRIKMAVKSKILFNLYRRYNFERKGYECIHGHFLPYKFTGPAATGIRYVTWLRNPLDRMCSHYYYWLRNYKEGKSPAMHTKVVKGKWTLEEFCLSKEMRNVYHQFLWKFPVQKFDFIGITEYFSEDLKYFSEVYLQKEVREIPRINANLKQNNRSYIIDNGLKNRIKEFHARDYEIYNYALKEREKRLNQN